jgi:hypothetical protein
MVERVTIPECPAFQFCRGKGVDCEICLSLQVDAWREHVKKVLRKP